MSDISGVTTADPRCSRRAAIAGGMLAALLTPAAAQDVPSAFRSVNDVRQRIPDELDRPAQRETSSHRGWEIRADQFTIVASTSLGDARWAAEQVASARQEMAAVLNLWTDVHRHPDFGLNSLQVVIDDQPLRERDAPPATINVVGLQSQIRIGAAPGQPPLKEQLLRLREGAAFALLHTAELDAALPPWVVHGLAAHAALAGQPPAAPQPNEFAPAAGDSWRWQRASQDRLDAHPLDRNQAEAQTTFLLTGCDAQHAPALVALLKQAAAEAARAAATGRSRQYSGSSQPPAKNSALDELVQASEAQFKAWQADRQTGLPIVSEKADTPAELLELERDLLVVLKLLGRVRAAKSASQPVKVVTFERDRGRTSSDPPIQQLPGISQLRSRLSDRSQPPLATIDADGRVLFSSDLQRIESLLGFDGQRFQTKQAGGRWVVATRLSGGDELHGWLEANRDIPSRPLAKFAVVKASHNNEPQSPAADVN